MKPIGKCPWCGAKVEGVVVTRNYLRRDKCKCPECGKKIYICRTPGCNNYTKGGVWDDEFCPDCTKVGAKHAVKAAFGTVLLLLTGQNNFR